MLCKECGTDFEPGEYHPRAFCVLYNAGIDPYELVAEAVGVETGDLEERLEEAQAEVERLRAALVAEREACAVIADSVAEAENLDERSGDLGKEFGWTVIKTARSIAVMIRERA